MTVSGAYTIVIYLTGKDSDMGTLAEQAVTNHKRYYSCSAAVLCAFARQAGLTEEEARQIAAPFSGGKMGKCGAVLAAEYVLEHSGRGGAEEQVRRFEERFADPKKGSVYCADLRGKFPGSCRACVTDAAEILEDMLAETPVEA